VVVFFRTLVKEVSHKKIKNTNLRNENTQKILHTGMKCWKNIKNGKLKIEEDKNIF